jgi:type VI secretion system protein ImpC
MTIKSSFADVKLDVNPGANPSERLTAAAPEPETPFRILLLGDFSGRASAADKPAIRWKPVLIDRDNFEEVLARLGVACPELSIGFRELDDFDPDAIYEQHSELFESPLGERMDERLKSKLPSTLSEAAAPLRPVPPPDPPRPATSAPAASGGSLLDAMLDAAEGEPAPDTIRHGRRDPLQSFVEKVTAPYAVPAEDPELIRRRQLSDAESGARMRAILHYPAFQALEAAWRAVFRLVREVDTDSQLKLYLLDISKAELEADLGSSADPRDSRTWRLLVEETVGTLGADPWAVVAGNYAFSRTAADAQMLGGLAKIMRFAGAPFLSEVDPGNSQTETEEAVRQWEALRQSPDATWIGLAMPRFLLRLPYGSKTHEVGSFEFEEMPGVPEHQHYLWGNPAFACVQLLAEAFAEYGWQMRPGVRSEIAGLPLHVYQAEGGTLGETEVKPCAEVLLTERDADWILNQGYMPLVSIKDRDAARLLRFQSIAKPLAALSGPWGY